MSARAVRSLYWLHGQRPIELSSTCARAIDRLARAPIQPSLTILFFLPRFL
jgi:hypothetical protein